MKWFAEPEVLETSNATIRRGNATMKLPGDKEGQAIPALLHIVVKPTIDHALFVRLLRETADEIEGVK